LTTRNGGKNWHILTPGQFGWPCQDQDMCGRYASARKRQELLEEFQVRREHADSELPPDYNVAPTKPVYAVLTRGGEHRDRSAVPAGQPGRDEAPGAAPPAEPEAPARQLRVLRWGLVPFWAKDPAIGSRLINARAETVAEKPAFRRAFARRRCLLPANGYYEWQAVDPPGDGPGAPPRQQVQQGQQTAAAPAGKRRARKVPYYIHPSDGGVLAFAGLYELWRRPQHGAGRTGADVPAADAADDPDSWLWTVTIITTQATDDLGHVHDRMPMVIERSRWADWLDPAHTDVGDLRELLVPAVSSGLDLYPVSPAVNNVRNNGPGLIEPAQAEVISPEQGTGGSPGSLF
jgi:putative SOS response-associated peptidase YedK